MKLRALASWFSTPVAKWGVVAFLAGAIGSAIAAPNPVSGPKPSDGGYQTSAAHAILIEADSGSVLFEKGADDLIPRQSVQVDDCGGGVQRDQAGLPQAHR
jgi:D-alanyl-D-alanine carboxypeptidase